MTAQQRLAPGQLLRAVPAPPRIDLVIGIDPGPGVKGTAGIGVLDLARPAASQVFQCTAESAPWLLGCLLEALAGTRQLAGQIEGFAPGRNAGAARHGQAVSRQVDEMMTIAARHGMPVAVRYAVLAKTWATDKRLRAAGLYDLAPGSAHGRDGLRHALYRAVHDCGFPDPLSPRQQAAAGGTGATVRR